MIHTCYLNFVQQLLLSNIVCTWQFFPILFLQHLLVYMNSRFYEQISIYTQSKMHLLEILENVCSAIERPKHDLLLRPLGLYNNNCNNNCVDNFAGCSFARAWYYDDDMFSKVICRMNKQQLACTCIIHSGDVIGKYQWRWVLSSEVFASKEVRCDLGRSSGIPLSCFLARSFILWRSLLEVRLCWL